MDIALDDNGDILWAEDGDLAIVTKQEAIVQNLEIRLTTFLGEWFLDTRLGVPIFQIFLAKNPSYNAMRSAIRKAVLGTHGIADMSEDYTLSLDTTNRKLSVSKMALVFDDSTNYVFNFEEVLA